MTFNRLTVDKPIFSKESNSKDDLTFRDLIIWYLEGDYIPQNDLKYETKSSNQEQSHLAPPYAFLLILAILQSLDNTKRQT